LREYARENPFRPLAFPITPGWYLPVSSPEMLHAAVETIYPGAIAAWAAHQQSNLNPATLEETIQRQTGMFRALTRLDSHQQTNLMMAVCISCARHPAWADSNLSDKDIPCIEPCNVWLSAALESIKHA
jgi:hypothetical protein